MKPWKTAQSSRGGRQQVGTASREGQWHTDAMPSHSNDSLFPFLLFWTASPSGPPRSVVGGGAPFHHGRDPLLCRRRHPFLAIASGDSCAGSPLVVALGPRRPRGLILIRSVCPAPITLFVVVGCATLSPQFAFIVSAARAQHAFPRTPPRFVPSWEGDMLPLFACRVDIGPSKNRGTYASECCHCFGVFLRIAKRPCVLARRRMTSR